MNRVGRRTYWYLICKVNGRIVVWLDEKIMSESDANQKGFSKLKNRPFIVIGRPYKDISRMTSEAKAMNLEDTGNIEESIRRASHQLDNIKYEDKPDSEI
jgi:hypothetical protein